MLIATTIVVEVRRIVAGKGCLCRSAISAVIIGITFIIFIFFLFLPIYKIGVSC